MTAAANSGGGQPDPGAPESQQRADMANAGARPLARLTRLSRAAVAVLRRHGPVVLGRHALLWLGGRRGYFLRDLLMEVPDFRAIPESGATFPQKLALCISGVGLDAMRYRCEHLAEQLELQGYSADVTTVEEARLPEALTRYAMFVLHRVMAAPDYLAFVAEARRRGKVVLFDTDDLVFDVSALDLVPGFQQFSAVERQYVADTIERNGRMLRACDAVTVSTESLREYIVTAGFHQRVVTIPNVVSDAMLRGGDDATASLPCAAASETSESSAPVLGQGDAPVTIGYFSGTKTHNQDVLEAADALLWALARYPQTRLQIVGHLTLDQRFERYTERITRVPLQPWQRLPRFYAAVDINLAPLERDNPYTEAKSCIKYLEAALCRVPTIASPRNDFRRVITPGVTGLLADTPAEWQAALARLIGSPAERHAMGQRACDEVRASETCAARAPATYALLRSLAPGAFAALSAQAQTQM